MNGCQSSRPGARRAGGDVSHVSRRITPQGGNGSAEAIQPPRAAALCRAALARNRTLAQRSRPSLMRVLPMLDERARRLVLGAVSGPRARAGPAGSLADRGVVADRGGRDGGGWPRRGRRRRRRSGAAGRVRRPGGGRRPLAESDPGLAGALEALIRDAMRGDPESPLTWTTRSAEHLAGELTAAGHRCSPAHGVADAAPRRATRSSRTPAPRRGASIRSGTPSSGTSPPGRGSTWRPGTR